MPILFTPLEPFSEQSFFGAMIDFEKKNPSCSSPYKHPLLGYLKPLLYFARLSLCVGTLVQFISSYIVHQDQ
jgi:hypothetical protein